MPILWRYLTRNFLKVFLLCNFGFIAILLILRAQDIARFASLGTSLSLIVRFTLYQIPNILPLALPISALISGYILMQNLSTTQELTAMRISGLSIHRIVYPLYLIAIVLGLVNFVIVSELTPRSRNSAKSMLAKIIYHNPLLLLKKNRLIKVKDSYVEMDTIQSGKAANDVLFAYKDTHTNRLGLILAKKLHINEEKNLVGKSVSSISYMNASEKKTFDHLFIDNQSFTKTEPKAFWLLTNNLKKKHSISQSPTSQIMRDLFKTKYNKKSRALVELIKRISLSFIVIAFTYLGIHYSIQTGRTRSKKIMLYFFLMITGSLICFMGARSFEKQALISIILYILPHPILFFLSNRRHRKVSRGVHV